LHFVMPTFRNFRGEHPYTTLDNIMNFISIDIRKLHFVMPTFRNFQGNTPPDYISKCFGSILVPPDHCFVFLLISGNVLLYYSMPFKHHWHAIQTPLDITSAKHVNFGSVDTRKSYLIMLIFQNFRCLNLGPKICQYIYEYKEIAFYNTYISKIQRVH